VILKTKSGDLKYPNTRLLGQAMKLKERLKRLLHDTRLGALSLGCRFPS
jgi:hypothetical protein